MIINGIEYLLLEKRGCTIRPEEMTEKGTDINNYRLCTPGEMIPCTDGRKYFFEFSTWTRYNYRTISKRGNKTLKHPVKELVNHNALSVNTQYTNPNNMSYRNGQFESAIYSNYDFSYTKANVLTVVNMLSCKHYQDIKYVCTLETYEPDTRNFTPAGLIIEYCTKHRLHCERINKTLQVSIYTGIYKYLCYNIEPLNNGYNKITLFLEEVEK